MLARYFNEPVEIDGLVSISKGADYVTVVGVSLNGRSTPMVSPSVYGNHATFLADDVTNDHSNICFDIGYPFGHPESGRPQGTVIYGNRIHDCGRLPATNHHHGIYVTFADDTVISHNWIVDNADRGVQLYPDAQRTKITDNLITANGEALSFGGENGVSAGGSRVTGNVLTESNVRYNVESFYPAGTSPGTDNLVTGNCISGGALGDVQDPQVGFSASSNSASTAACRGVPGLVGPESLVGRAATPAPAPFRGAAPPARFRLAVKLRSHLRGRGRRRCRFGRIRATVSGGDRRFAIRGDFYRDGRSRGRDTHPPLSRIVVKRHRLKTQRHRVQIQVRLVFGQLALFSRTYRECGR